MKNVIDQAVDLLRIVERYDVEELELEVKGIRFHLSKGQVAAAVPAPEQAPRPAPAEAPPPATQEPPEPPEDKANYATITSPMVGMFYRASAPDKPPFIDVGQIVELDQPVCIIEAMKLMNIIKANVRGRVVKVMAENQSPVQAGQVLFLIEAL